MQRLLVVLAVAAALAGLGLGALPRTRLILAGIVFAQVGCLLAILARLAQARSHHQALVKQLEGPRAGKSESAELDQA